MEITQLLTIIGIIVAVVAIALTLLKEKKTIMNFFRHLRPKESVAIFGPAGAGKTTLISYLQGKSLPIKHNYTFGAQPVGRIVYDLTGHDTYFFRSREMYDVGGEHLPQWEAIIKKQNPDGIIYIVDTTDPNKEAKGLKKIWDIYEDIATQKLSPEIRLRALLILLNKADIWSCNQEEGNHELEKYRNSILTGTCELFEKTFGDIQIHFEWTSLTKSGYRNHNNDALRNFAAVLATR
jgi:signal recognition particle receptor subunit beta